MSGEPARHQRTAGSAIAESRGKEEHTALLAALRLHIMRLEQSLPQLDGRPRHIVAWNTGLAAIDRHLPVGGLARSGLHDITPKRYGDLPAAMGFALALALRRLADPSERRPVLWCRLAREEREYGRLYGHGLESLGLARHRFVTVTLKRPMALLWTMEEALKCGALSLVIADADAKEADLTATRRLGLAAQAGKSAGLLVFARAAAPATASHTRWLASPALSRAPLHDTAAPGLPAWTLELTRARGGRPGAWTVEWQNAPHRFNLVSGFPHRAFHPWADETGKAGAPEGAALCAG